MKKVAIVGQNSPYPPGSRGHATAYDLMASKLCNFFMYTFKHRGS